MDQHRPALDGLGEVRADGVPEEDGHGPRGAEVLGASKDTVDKLQQFRANEGLTFPLLSDAEGDVCERYGVWKEKSNYGRTYLGIERTTFVIDEEGRIVKVFPKVKVEGHAEAVLATVT